MNTRWILLLVSALVFSFALFADQSSDADNSANQSLSPEQKSAIEGYFADQNLPKQSDVEAKPPPKLSGEWKTENGSLDCDGFLTRVANEDFCSVEVPEDWRPFQFNGKTYYVQPLA